jgi:hypothetical protein
VKCLLPVSPLMRPLLPLLASACFVQPLHVGRASLRLMGNDLIAMTMQQGRPGTVAVGATLQLPVPRMVEVSGVAPSATSLEQLAGGRGKLVLLVCGESAMSERYRQALLALRDVAWSELGAQVAR